MDIFTYVQSNNHQVGLLVFVFFFFFFVLCDSEFHSKYFHTINENGEPELSFPMRLCQVGVSFAEAD